MKLVTPTARFCVCYELKSQISRNLRIARVFTEFGWVQELHEGVKRIYSDRAEFFLEDPEYTEPSGAVVRLMLKNNIKVRKLRRQDRAVENAGSEAWENIDDLEKDILAFMGSRQQVTRADLSDVTNRSAGTITSRLNKLIDKGLVRRQGGKHVPKQTYVLV